MQHFGFGHNIYIGFLTKGTSFLYCTYALSVEFLRRAPWAIRLTDFVAKVFQLCTRLITPVGNKASILCQIKKAFQRYPETCSKYCRTYNEIINEMIIY